MAVIFQIWTDSGQSVSLCISCGAKDPSIDIAWTWDDWKKSQQAILYDVFDSPKYRAIAPYIVHSIDFDSEPVTDGMDMIRVDGGTQFIKDLALLRQKASNYSIPVGISEEWDDMVRMHSYSQWCKLAVWFFKMTLLSYFFRVRGWHVSRQKKSVDGTSLGSIGAGVKANSDYVHAHIMSYYRPSISLYQSWSYIQGQIECINQTVQLPTLITETQWAWARNVGHVVHRSGLTVSGYTQYWNKFDEECEMFKKW
jgi:hypothetical protein